MHRLGGIVEKIRSKNAGPFWLTIDIFCGSDAAFETVSKALKTGQVADVFCAQRDSIKRFDIPDLCVIKFSLPRPTVQGSPQDRDMHGASYGALLADLEI
ncbi:MAG: DUF4387 family protein [Rhodobacterales bacterium]|nr:DUF4387 family protein [Rhodobacterales bacterium]